MTKCEGLANDDVAVAAMVVVVQVGSAQTGGLDGNLNLVGSRSRDVSVFLYVC